MHDRSYQKPPELYDGLRLHQNENTGGCSPRVLEALARLRADQIGFYPPYAAATDARARAISASTADRIALVNGLDEGIMALAVAYLRAVGRRAACSKRSSRSRRSRSSASTPRSPAARLVQVMPQRRLQLSARRGARGDHAEHARRVPDQPEQPDRRRRCRSTRSATIARRVPPGAVVFVDEAYAEFAGVSVHPRARRVSRTSIVGRTFSKAFGLAGLRIGCLVGAPDDARSDPARGAGLQRQHRRRGRASRRRSTISITCSDYLRQVAESKALLYAACDRLGLALLEERVELRAGPRRRPRPTRWSRAPLARGIYLRDRSTEPGCAGCIRIGDRHRRAHARAASR